LIDRSMYSATFSWSSLRRLVYRRPSFNETR